MPRLTVCSTCGIHTRTDAAECAHCGAPPRRNPSTGLTLAAVLLGLTAASCEKDPTPTTPPAAESGGDVAEPMYGVPMSDDGGVDDGGADEGGDADDGGLEPPEEPPIEAMYGVPASDESS